MSEVQYNVKFEKLCNVLQLGELIDKPKTMAGGLLHRMYAMRTTQGKFAIKALNPQVMQRPTAKSNFINSERVANLTAKTMIPALPAKEWDGNALQEIDNQFYLVFDWVEGKSLKTSEIDHAHCETIGEILADIHRIDFSSLRIARNESDHAQRIQWNDYLQKGQEHQAVWQNLLHDVIDQLYKWDVLANHSAQMLATDQVISHGDLDPKNVLWHHHNPTLIDWESAGWRNPLQDLMETAVYWSENEMGSLDKEKFFAFIKGYKKKSGALQADWSTVLNMGFLGKLGWLEYNLKRSLWMECTDDTEQQLGTDQVTATIHDLRRYAEQLILLEDWLTELTTP